MEAFKGSLTMITNPAVFAYVMKGVAFTIVISVVAVLCGILFGSILAMVRNYCTTKKTRVFQWLSVIYIEIFRNTPLLLWIFICLVFCPCPKVLEHKMWGLSSAEVKLLFKTAVALILFTSSVIAEIVRGGLNSVAHGQFEAGHSQGFGYLQRMYYIILPQSIKIILPPMVNQAVNLIKNTSCLYIVGGADLISVTYSFVTGENTGGAYAPAYLVSGLLFFIVCCPLSSLASMWEISLKKRDVRTGRPAKSLEGVR